MYSQAKDETTGLTRQQRAVLELLEKNYSQQEVATALGVSRQRIRQVVESLWRHGYVVKGTKPPRDWNPEDVTAA